MNCALCDAEVRLLPEFHKWCPQCGTLTSPHLHDECIVEPPKLCGVRPTQIDAQPMFLDELTAYYADHHLAPSLILASIKDKDETKYYVSIHTFPNGLNSRKIVCKATKQSLDDALAELMLLWRTANTMLQEPSRATDES